MFLSAVVGQFRGERSGTACLRVGSPGDSHLVFIVFVFPLGAGRGIR